MSLGDCHFEITFHTLFYARYNTSDCLIVLLHNTIKINKLGMCYVDLGMETARERHVHIPASFKLATVLASPSGTLDKAETI